MRRNVIVWLFCILAAFCAPDSLRAQGTAFTYQGRLNDGGSPANGSYDLQFALYDAPTNGNTISVPQTNLAVAVASGLFTTNLDFGAVFTGTSYWLSIGVRTNGNTNAFTLLWPRQPVLPVPYAIFANTASNLLGTLAATQLSGTLPASAFAGYTNTVALTNSANSFAGSFNGTFSGNGGGVTNVNVSSLTGVLADSQLPANTAFVNSNQTFTGNNQFNGANNFTNLYGNSFSGSFFGNGLVGWIATNGTAVQAQIDHGYLLTNSQLVTVTLPATPNVGDIVRISGAGAGGWLVKENSGQSIFGNLASYTNSGVLNPLTTSSGTSYGDVAASADGTRIYYVGSDTTGVDISSDSGAYNLSQITTPYFSGPVYSIACSANGKIVYAEPGAGGIIQKSTDGGLTWASSGNSATGTAIACSADGSKLFYNANYACSGDGTYVAKLAGGAITISTNGGTSFPITITGPSGTVTCLAASSDCTRLLVGINNGLLYASANQGNTWTPLTSTSQYWFGAWMSPDGSKFAAAAITSGVVTGGVYYCAVSPQPDTISTNNSTIGGSQGSAVELQYIGNGRFMPVSSTGLIWAN
jgi:hypothetical protein